MRNLILTIACAGLVSIPAMSSSQSTQVAPPPPPPPATPAQPIITTGATAAAVRAGTADPKIKVPDGGGPNSPIAIAVETLNSIRAACTLVENDGKLFAACDNTTAAARNRSGTSYVPQLATEWEVFAKKLVDADWTANGKRRPVVVLNLGEVVAESNSAGVVRLRK